MDYWLTRKRKLDNWTSIFLRSTNSKAAGLYRSRTTWWWRSARLPVCLVLVPRAAVGALRSDVGLVAMPGVQYRKREYAFSQSSVISRALNQFFYYGCIGNIKSNKRVWSLIWSLLIWSINRIGREVRSKSGSCNLIQNHQISNILFWELLYVFLSKQQTSLWATALRHLLKNFTSAWAFYNSVKYYLPRSSTKSAVIKSIHLSVTHSSWNASVQYWNTQ